MRELKFKVWDKTINKFITHRQKEKTVKKCFGFTSHEEVILAQEQFKFLQFTGLKDKNGKEIYEGDVVEFNNFDYERTGGHLDDEIVVGEVEYSCGAWAISAKNGQGYDLYNALVNDDEFEVIGNIYENPSLLEQS